MLFEEWNSESSPGMALGIIQNGMLSYGRGYGMANLEHHVPIAPSTVFYIGSVSKQFVTFCILLLEEKGLLNLDDPVQKFLPDFPDYGYELTIRHFIHHTSGVRDNLTLWQLSGYDYLDYVPKEGIYELIKRQKSLNFQPGERYMYSNSCYFMLSMIIEKASGLSLKEFANREIFLPLGMNNTHFHDDNRHIIKGRASSYIPNSTGFYNQIMRFDLVGSGGLYSTIEDLFLWDQNFYENKLGMGGQKLIESMQEEGKLNNGESCGYAFALVIGTYRGLKTVSHGGVLAGYRAELMRFPEEKTSIIILGNAGPVDVTLLSKQAADIVLGDKMEAIKDPRDESFEPLEQKTESDELKIDVSGFQGVYYSEELDVDYKLFMSQDQLMFKIRYNPAFPLKGVSQDLFSSTLGLEFRFRRTNNEINGFSLNAGRVQNVYFTKN